MADGETRYKQHLLDFCQKRGDVLGRIVQDCILVHPQTCMLLMPNTIANAMSFSIMVLTYATTPIVTPILMIWPSPKLLMLLVMIAKNSGKSHIAIKVDLSCVAVS